MENAKALEHLAQLKEQASTADRERDEVRVRCMTLEAQVRGNERWDEKYASHCSALFFLSDQPESSSISPTHYPLSSLFLFLHFLFICSSSSLYIYIRTLPLILPA